MNEPLPSEESLNTIAPRATNSPTPQIAWWSESRGNWLAIGILAILTLIFMWRVTLLGEALLPLDAVFTAEPWASESQNRPTGPIWNPIITDAIWQFYPMAVYGRLAWQQGSLFWDPSVLAGMPALARGEMFSNPVFNLLATFVPVHQAISWAAVIHLFMAGLFTWMLLREMGLSQFGALVGALAFEFNGYLIGWLSLPVVIGSMVWLPLIFFGVERALRKGDWRWTLLSALGFCIQILSGSVLWPFYGAITLLIFTLIRGIFMWRDARKLASFLRPLFYSSLALVIGGALSAPFSLLTAELFSYTGRSGPIGKFSHLNFYSQAIRLLVPEIYGDHINGNTYWGPFNFTETNLYFGILPLTFIIASLFSSNRKYVWGLVGIGSIALLAIYKFFPFRELVSVLYPIFLNSFPGRIFYVVAFTWSLAIGFGADWLLTQRPRRLTTRLGALTAGISGIVLIIFTIARYYQTAGKEAAFYIDGVSDKIARLNSANILVAFLLLVTSALLLWLWSRGQVRSMTFSSLALGLITLDLLGAGINYNPTFDPKLSFQNTPSITALQEIIKTETEPYRIITANSNTIIPGMVPQLYDIPTVTGYSSWVLQRYSLYADLTQDRWTASINHIYFDDCCHRLLDALNIKYIYTSPETLLSSSGTLDLMSDLNHAQIEAQDDEYVQLTEWTIDNLTQPILYQHPPSSIHYALNITRPSVFKTAIALDPTVKDKNSDGVLFEITITESETADETLVFSHHLDPKTNRSEPIWIPVEIDFSQRYLGKNIILTLHTNPGPNGDTTFDWAGWVHPHIENYYPPSLRLIYNGPNKIYKNPNALPRAWVVHQTSQVDEGDIEAVMAHLGNAEFNPAVEAVIEGTLPAELGKANINDRVNVREYTAEKVIIDAEITENGLLILSDVMYPGWKVYVDGVERQILTTNLIMRGVFLESGNHEVIFVYKPTPFYIGVGIAGATLISIIAAMIYHSRRSSP